MMLPHTTKRYGRTSGVISLDEIERILIWYSTPGDLATRLNDASCQLHHSCAVTFRVGTRVGGYIDGRHLRFRYLERYSTGGGRIFSS